jgi:hypothetical protein
MGATIRAGAGWVFEVRVPPVGQTTVRLVRDGEVVHSAAGVRDVRWSVEAPGAYRVEVDLRANLFPIATPRDLPWIFSNAVYVQP